ncbi:hypothetical protein AK88_00019 [Plasmodium fragile]|uniref:CRAL-TRIO domain-containing protein n=1 Tax=Plasmodium fragile TaxID=5857 RepID=A0A0D9QUC6_PLAFR|nr:uncharacterized protein AK88_00019 [Plasmodium fragile]KJP90171.1 hypothetical protein AK88_00019 [Plasmodium fragile]
MIILLTSTFLPHLFFKSLDGSGAPQKTLQNTAPTFTSQDAVTISVNTMASEYITEKVLMYEPTEEEIKYHHKNQHKSLRYIFCGKELDEFEKEKIKQLKEIVNDIKKKESDGKGVETYESMFANTIFEDDNYVLRFLQGNEFNFEKCYYDMIRHLEWRDENLPVLYEDIKDMLEKGYIYVHGRDKKMHPIIIINCKSFITADTKDVLKVAYYWMEFIISKLFIEGKIEQWRVIIDLSSCGVLTIPIGTLKDISKCLSCNYRSRLSKMLILSAPLFVTGMWHMMKSIIPVVTQQKITISSAETDKDVLKVAYYWMEFIISKLFIEGKIEQWRVIIDLSSCGVLTIPIGTLKDISKCLSCNYRSRLSKMLILSAPLFVTGMWHMMKSIIPVVTQQKITISSAETDKNLLEQVDLDQLEQKYGGTAENATIFTKPIMP